MGGKLQSWLSYKPGYQEVTVNLWVEEHMNMFAGEKSEPMFSYTNRFMPAPVLTESEW